MPPRRKAVHIDEYIPPKERPAPLVNTHTDYGHNNTHRTIHVPIPTGVHLRSAIQPALHATTSPTPRLDWVLQVPELPYKLYDGDLEIAEMEDCELEALGLTKYIRKDSKERVDVPQKRQKTQSTHPILFWTPYIDLYVDEFLRLEGRGSSDLDRCAICTLNLSSTAFRCKDCQSEVLTCANCMVSTHRWNPFHRIEQWTGTYFTRVTLKDLGLRIQLGHADSSCLAPVNAFNNDFVVIAANGVHEVSLDYCGCTAAQSKPTQLLRARLFPSTVTDPKTAATFGVLEQFQLLTFTSKVSGYEFYRSLARMTDNTGVSPPPDRYPVFMRIVREWRHIRLLKRMGRGHSASGVKGTKEGECAVLCPACPQPGKNLPADWKERPDSEQWLYSLFIGIDANFRLKRMNVSSDERDPALNHGYAYVVENSKFKAYLRDYDKKVPEESKNTCNNHDAIKSASARGGNGTAASGLGTAECSRHDMKRPLAVGDLQKGERYVNMDYFFLSSIHDTLLWRIVVSYDIACQWSCNLLKRCNVYPANILSTATDLTLTYLVPKFHLAAHVPKCQTAYSFNYTPGVGRTDGEAPERGWSATNGIASSTKEMGPGSRSDTLDDHFGDYNWRKIITIAETFVRKAKEAISEREENVEAFIEFDAALPVDITASWTKLCQAWEADQRKPNPFVIKKNTVVTESDVRLRLAREDAEALVRGDAVTIHEDISPSVLISQGIQIEDLQVRLAYDVSELGPHSTSLQQTKVLERSNSLKRRIDAWISIQHLYMPGVALLRARDDAVAASPVAVQDIKLFLPSFNSSTLLCAKNLLLCEWQFRFSQAEETLNTLRGHLLLRSHMWKSKNLHSRGQKQQTRSRKLLSDVDNKISATVKTYNAVYHALEVLSVPLLERTWRNIFRPLAEGDVVGLTSMDDSGSEGRKRLSWIWKVHGTGASADECTQAALRVEWCKARARAHRWQEECLLLAEEMRRVSSFFSWQKNWWKSLAANLTERSECLREGKVAYANRQADIRANMELHCKTEWEGISARLMTMDDRDPSVVVECH